MVRVFISYRLKDGVSRDEYRKWSREVDKVIASRQPGVRSYKIFEIQGAGKGEPGFDYMEDIEADSREAWEKVNGYPEMKEVVDGWMKLCDPDSVQVTYGTEV